MIIKEENINVQISKSNDILEWLKYKIVFLMIKG